MHVTIRYCLLNPILVNTKCTHFSEEIHLKIQKINGYKTTNFNWEDVALLLVSVLHGTDRRTTTLHFCFFEKSQHCFLEMSKYCFYAQE